MSRRSGELATSPGRHDRKNEIRGEGRPIQDGTSLDDIFWAEELIKDAQNYVRSVFDAYTPMQYASLSNKKEKKLSANNPLGKTQKMKRSIKRKSTKKKKSTISTSQSIKNPEDGAKSSKKKPSSPKIVKENRPEDSRDDWKEASISEAIKCASSLLTESNSTLLTKTETDDTDTRDSFCVDSMTSPRSATKDIYNITNVKRRGNKNSHTTEPTKNDIPLRKDPISCRLSSPKSKVAESHINNITNVEKGSNKTSDIPKKSDFTLPKDPTSHTSCRPSLPRLKVDESQAQFQQFYDSAGHESWESVFVSGSYSRSYDSDEYSAGSRVYSYDSISFSEGSKGEDTSETDLVEATVRTDLRIEGSGKRSSDEEGFSLNNENGSKKDYYDTWNLLRDEYAQDFGFHYRNQYDSESSYPTSSDDDNGKTKFRILGTSIDDNSTQPRVLTPPLMESLLYFVPESISKQNLWLKYSLVRDGANLMTLQQYVRSSTYTILSIETSKGDVFGCFTSSPWTRSSSGFYGNGQAFVWKMRHNRYTECHSLIEKAKMEQEIDVYPYSNCNNFVQLCTNSMLAVGAGDLRDNVSVREMSLPGFPELDSQVSMEDAESGFAIALDQDLHSGTSSPCATFCNPCLAETSASTSQVFEVSNLEIWAFTPCTNVHSAEKLEMMKFLRYNSSNSSNITDSGDIGISFAGTPSSTLKNASVLDQMQKKFYQRVGEKVESNMR